MIENVAVQGPNAVSEIVAALKRLDADPTVEVIVIARGGGGVEDLLPFSNETLVRAVSAARTPVVSAIGHETDAPLLDLVADLAASTPTDAAKRVVPDLVAEHELVRQLRARNRQCIRRRVQAEAELMAGLPERLRATVSLRLTRERDQVGQLVDRSGRRTKALITAGQVDVEHIRARVTGLSPKATLDRGYAVITRADGSVVRAPDEALGLLAVRVSGGSFTASKVAQP